MTRRNPVLTRVLVALMPVAFTTAAVAADHTNVIIIYADDLGWGDLGCYGHPSFKTPNLDTLAEEGARLTQFQSSCPYCAPARAALQTGRYQIRSGVTRNPTPDANINDVGMPDREITLGEAFKSAGYATICVGKWHLGHRPEFHPLRHGYDHYLGILYSNDMRPVELWEDDKVIEYPVVQATLTKRYTRRVLDFITANRGRPFFCYFPHAMPHKPLACSEDFYQKTGTGLYGDVIAEVDWSVGQIIAKLRELDLDRRTLVFFTSDNGPWYGGSTGGLRGMKGRTWEGGIRVPMIAWWPGHIPAGITNDAPAIIMDLYATSLAAARVPLPPDHLLDGRDIMPLLTDANAESPHDVLLSFAGDTLKSVRAGNWKLHVAPPQNPKERIYRPDEGWTDPRGPDGVTILAPYEQAHPSEYPGLLTGDVIGPGQIGLFNLGSDPCEQRNVADEHPDLVARLSAAADRIVNATAP